MAQLIKFRLYFLVYFDLWFAGDFYQISLILYQVLVQWLFHFTVLLTKSWIIKNFIQNSEHQIFWFIFFNSQKLFYALFDVKKIFLWLILSSNLIPKYFFNIFQPSSQNKLSRFWIFCQVAIMITKRRKLNISFSYKITQIVKGVNWWNQIFETGVL